MLNAVLNGFHRKNDTLRRDTYDVIRLNIHILNCTEYTGVLLMRLTP